MLQKIQEAYLNRDLEALDNLAVPTRRILNKKNDFKSVLMLSCNNIKHLSKIETLEADAIVLNLEDGVSAEDKPFALVLCAIFLSQIKQSDKKLIVRVNALDNGGYEEITYLNQFMPDAIRVPKIMNAKEVSDVTHILNDGIELHLSIETASAWSNLSQLAQESSVKAFHLGILDLFADMGLSQSFIKLNNPTLEYILSHFLVTSLSIGVRPVSFIFQDFQDLDMFSKWLDLEKSMGYEAKGCISPAQVKLVNRILTNQEKEIQRARTIIKLFEMHESEGITGFVDAEFGFIDEPIYKGALKLI